MSLHRTLSRLLPLVPVLAAVLGPAGEGWAQKPPPPVKPNPLAPTLALPMPLGMQRGTSLDLTLTGTNLAEPTGLLLSFPCKVTIPSDNNNGKDNAKLRVRLEVPADAPPGYHSLHLATTRGMSNLRLFCIDDLPQVLKADTNRNKATPQQLTVPCVVAGRIDAEASDYYKITVKAGQRFSFDVLGHRLGSPIDPRLTVYDAKTMRELAHADDSPGAQTDPRLSYVFKEAGDYLIEINDVLNKGGADYCYRMRVGDFPLATVPVPMAAQRGGKVAVQFAGPAVEGVAPVEVAVPADPAVHTLWMAPKGPSGLLGWPVALALSSLPETVEQEPNQEPAKANRVPVPGGVTGRFQQSADVDLYLFAAKKGQKLLIDAKTQEWYSPTLVYMTVKAAKGGGELAKTNPQAVPPADQRIDFTPPDDGDYLLEVQHLNYAGGPDEAYHVSIAPSHADFGLALGIDRYDVAPGSVAPLTVLVTRRGYTGPIDVSVVGPKGLGGKATVAAGQAAGTLLLEAAPDLAPGPYLIAIKGTAQIDKTAVTEYVNVRKALSDSLAGLTYPPRQLDTQVAVAVTQKPPFQLTARIEPAKTAPGLTATLVVSATRDAGFAEAISLGPLGGLPPNVKDPGLKAIPKGQTEVKAKITIDPKAPAGTYAVFVTGKGKYQNKDVSANARPAELVVGAPFDLKVEPAMLSLAQGSKAKLKVVVTRHGGYDGPVAVELRNLPAKVTAGKVVIDKGKNAAELEVTAAADAAAGPKMDVSAAGTATALGNLQGTSPTFIVSVRKK